MFARGQTGKGLAGVCDYFHACGEGGRTCLSQSKPSIQMVYRQNHASRIKQATAAIYGWDCPLQTFTYPGFYVLSATFSSSGAVEPFCQATDPPKKNPHAMASVFAFWAAWNPQATGAQPSRGNRRAPPFEGRVPNLGASRQGPRGRGSIRPDPRGCTTRPKRNPRRPRCRGQSPFWEMRKPPKRGFHV